MPLRNGEARVVEQLITAFFELLKKAARREARTEGVAQVLDYAGIWQNMVKAFWLFPLTIGAVALYSPPSAEERWYPLWIILGFSAIILPLTLEVLKRRIDLTDKTISQRSAWSKPVTIAWKDVRDVSWKLSGEVVVVPKSGRTIRVNAWLSGMETFAQVLEKRLAHLPATPKVARAIRVFLGPVEY
jgi:hypothetical protein